MTGPSKATPAGRAYRALQALATRDHRPTDELLIIYALEGFLERLTRSPHARKFVVKGGVLLAAYDARRPTRDVDLLATAMANDTDTVLALIRDIAAVELADGLAYDTAAATAETIRDDGDYAGVRVSLTATLATAVLPLHIDVNVGDPVWPEPRPIQLGRLLGDVITVTGYPLSMVHAEKIVTALQRGTANTRWRDFADVYLLSGTHPVDGNQLQASLHTVAEGRSADLEPLSTALDGYAPLGQIKWAAWIRKQKLTQRLPTDFATVLDHVAAFADPALSGRASGTRWNPATRSWEPPA